LGLYPSGVQYTEKAEMGGSQAWRKDDEACPDGQRPPWNQG